MLFRDRKDAGKQLAIALQKYKNNPNTVVIGLPRGGVVLSYEVAKELNLPMDVVCPRKIGAPGQPELAIGAITETGDGIFNEELLSYLNVSPEHIEQEVEEEKKQAKHRLDIYRKGMPPRKLKNQTVIIVDDGLATGSTMKAAIKSIKAEGAAYLVVAVPVSPKDTYYEVQDMVDEIISLDTPSNFYAVGQFYEIFDQTDDEEVIDLMRNSKH